jgi:transcription antitermination factor NusG
MSVMTDDPKLLSGDPELQSAGPARWFALTVRHQHERQTSVALGWKGLETLVPCYSVRRRWSDRIQEVETALFAGYVFCRFEPRDKLRVLNTPGVVRIVGFGGAPAPVDDWEMAALRSAMESSLPLWPWPHLQAGDRVRVERGPLRGVEGTLLRPPEGLRLVIGVELLRRSIAVELEPDMIAPLSPQERSLREAEPPSVLAKFALQGSYGV